MTKISVITPSIRPKGLKLVKKALKQQTFKDFEWLVNDKRYEGGVWGLQRAYNDLVRDSKGELLVSWQDYTYAKPRTLERFWSHYKNNDKILVSAVGNKYKTDKWIVKTWQDPRERDDMGSFYEVNPSDVEWNLCMCPREAIIEIGGFDEGADFKYYGMDGYGVNERLDAIGYRFYLDQSLKSYSLEHGRLDDWDEYNGVDGAYQERKQKQIDKGSWPTLKYIKNDAKFSKTSVRHTNM